MIRLVVSVLVLTLLVAGCERRPDEPAGVGAKSAAAAITPAPKQAVQEVGGVRFIVILTGGAGAGEALPTVVGMHGRGDNPENYAAIFSGLHARGRVVVPFGFIPTEDHGYQWFEVDHSVGRRPEVFERGAAEAMPKVMAFLEALPKALPMKGKPIVTGFSQGGVLAHAIAVNHPDAIALAASVGGFLPPALLPATRPEGKLARIVAFHGDVDPTVSHTWDQTSVEREKAAGYPAELRLFPGVAHAYGDEERADYSNLLDAALRAADKDG